MTHFSIAGSSLLVLLPTIFAFPQNDLSQSNPTSEITRWWDYKDVYTDMPRYFNLAENKCPAPSFYLDCNTCFCDVTSEGVSVPGCSRMMCSQVPQIYNFGEDGQGCPAGRQFYHRCNSCKCGSDGVTATCTQKLCNEPSNESGETENETSNESYETTNEPSNESGETENEPSNEPSVTETVPSEKPGLKKNEPPTDKGNGNPGLIKQVVHPIVQGVRTSISNLGKGLKLW